MSKTMTVAQLIEELSKLPKDIRVVAGDIPNSHYLGKYIEIFQEDDGSVSILGSSISDEALAKAI